MDATKFCAEYLVDRHGTDCRKWDGMQDGYGSSDLLAMWIADTEFRVPEAVTGELLDRVRHGAFGYTFASQEYYDAFFDWEERHHGWRPQREWMHFTPGVVSALYWYVNAFTQPDDPILVLTPVYGPFGAAARDTGRRLVTCPLHCENGAYSVDFEAFERAIETESVKLFINCSPHNPVGRVWTEDELDRMFAICERHGVLIVSDEIHQDIIMEGHRHIPALAVGGGKYAGRILLSNAPSKTFNTCGLVLSHVIIQDPALRERYRAYCASIGSPGVNSLALFATMAAYRHGDEWLRGEIATVWHNYCLVRDTLAKEAPDVVVTPLEGTYLMWLDFRAVLRPEEVRPFFLETCKLAVSFSESFTFDRQGFVRLNIGTDPKLVEEAIGRIVRGLGARR